jgi:hypothetical protein
MITAGSSDTGSSVVYSPVLGSFTDGPMIEQSSNHEPNTSRNPICDIRPPEVVALPQVAVPKQSASLWPSTSPSPPVLHCRLPVTRSGFERGSAEASMMQSANQSLDCRAGNKDISPSGHKPAHTQTECMSFGPHGARLTAILP